MVQKVRTTVDLPPEATERIKRIARERGQSLSATIVELTIRGLASLGEPAMIRMDPISGLPTLTLDRRVLADEVAEVLDEE